MHPPLTRFPAVAQPIPAPPRCRAEARLPALARSCCTGKKCSSIPLPEHLSAAPDANFHFGPVCFQQLAHSSAIRWGWGAGGNSSGGFLSLPRYILTSLLPVSYPILTIRCSLKFSLPASACNSASPSPLD